MSISLSAYLDESGRAVPVTSPADLDAVYDRVTSGGVALHDEGTGRQLFVDLHGCALVWEGDGDILIVAGTAPSGLAEADAVQDDLRDFPDWIAEELTFAVPPAVARAAGHEFLRTGRRPTGILWIMKP